TTEARKVLRSSPTVQHIQRTCKATQRQLRSKTCPFYADGRVGAGLRHLHGQPLAERNQKQLCAVTSASITPVISSQSCSAFSLSARLNSSDIGCGIS